MSRTRRHTARRSAFSRWLEGIAWTAGVLVIVASALFAFALPSVARTDFGPAPVAPVAVVEADDPAGPPSAPPTTADSSGAAAGPKGRAAAESKDDAAAAPAAQSTELTRGALPSDRARETEEEVGFLGWSASRVASFLKAKAQGLLPEAVAQIHIPAIGLEAPVFEGSDRRTLDLGVGTIEGTADLAASGGNAGLAGHRDGHFRRLGALDLGDRIEIRLPDRTRTYRVTDSMVVDPEDVWVLDPTAGATITLVTCFPFEFLGNAPERFVVRARLLREEIHS